MAASRSDENRGARDKYRYEEHVQFGRAMLRKTTKTRANAFNIFRWVLVVFLWFVSQFPCVFAIFRATKKSPPLCDIPSGCCFFTGPWTVTRSSLRMLRRVATFCRPLRPVLLLVSFPRSRSPVVGVLGLC